jgi:hypothetical protein
MLAAEAKAATARMAIARVGAAVEAAPVAWVGAELVARVGGDGGAEAGILMSPS